MDPYRTMEAPKARRRSWRARITWLIDWLLCDHHYCDCSVYGHSED